MNVGHLNFDAHLTMSRLRRETRLPLFCQQSVLTVLFVSLGLVATMGQDVEQTITDLRSRLHNPFTYSGSVGMEASLYGTNLETNRAAPFIGSFTAGLNLGIFGVQTPFNFVYSSGGTAFNVRLPSFGFAGLSPSYKGYTLHLGDRSMSLGKYSFSNHSFRGAGGEVRRDKWNARSFYGRLQRARVSDFQGLQNVDPLLKRMGWGALVGYQPRLGSNVDFSLFKAWDDINSIPLNRVDSSYTINGAQNAIFSTRVEQSIGNSVSLELNYSSSGYTERLDLEETKTSFVKSYLGILKTSRSTRWKNAMETKVKMETEIGQLNISFERIDPGYRTMGALFFQDDQQNITGGIATQLFSRKVSLIFNGGVQQNNLNGDKVDQYNRIIASLQSNIALSQKLQLNAGFTNFSSVNRQTRIIDPNTPNLLTELALTNANLTVGISYSFSAYQRWITNFSWQKNQTITTSDQILEQINKIISANSIFTQIWTDRNLTGSAQFYFNQFSMADINQSQKGVTLQVNKALKSKKVNLTSSISYNRNEQNNDIIQQIKKGNLMQGRLGCQFSISDRQRLLANVILFSNRGQNIQSYGEARFNIRYSASIQSARR